MTKTITISRAGHLIGATGIPETVRAMAQSIAKINVTGPFQDLTDNSGGVATTNTVLQTADPTDVAAQGSNLASSSDIGTNLSALRDGLATLFAQVNAVAVACGFAPITYAGGGTSGGLTVAAIPVAVSGASTSAPALNVAPILNAYDQAIYNLAVLVNRICEATGDTPAKLSTLGGPIKVSGSVPALAVTVAASGNPGVSQADVQNALTIFRNNVAVIAAAINRATTPGALRVIAIR